MNWINPLDKLPQVPVDYANHIVYGGALGVALTVAHFSPVRAALVVLGVAAAKKIVDFFKENESATVCIAKTLVTALWPATIVLVHSLPKG